MLVASLGDQVLTKDQSLQAAVDLCGHIHKFVLNLLNYSSNSTSRVDHLHGNLEDHPDVPLQVHARYSRIEILAASVSETGRR